MKHAFTVDLEDWYQGIPIPDSTKAQAERRLKIGTHRLLEILDRYRVTATFFVLGTVASEYPALLQEISREGHELGCHGLSHDLLYQMTPERFRDETRTSICRIEDCCGVQVLSYRAAYFSITKRSLWALDILAREGIRVDSSIFPVRNWRYGIPGFSHRPVVIETMNGPIVEFPISVHRLLFFNVPVSGGAYFRLYPYWLTRMNIQHSEGVQSPVVFYIHPWEFDLDQPRLRFDFRARVTHYLNLRTTSAKLERLLNEFQFGTLQAALRTVQCASVLKL